jgi:hypothetical protein
MSVDSPVCPYCDVLLSQVSSVLMIDVHGEQQIETKHVCPKDGCGSSWNSYIEATSIFSVVGARFVPITARDEIETVGETCNQPICAGSVFIFS